MEKIKMRILYICHRLPPFILNEIIELKNQGHEIFILTNDPGKLYKAIEPIVRQKGLDKHLHTAYTSYESARAAIVRQKGLDKHLYAFFVFQNRRQKYGKFLLYFVYDLYFHSKCAAKAFWYLIKNHPSLRCGVIDYLDIRNIFGSRVDIIHSPFSTPQMVDKVYFLAKILNVPFTLCFRAHDLYQNNNMHEHNQRIAVINQAAKIITIARYNREFIQNNLGIDQDIEIIHSAIDPGIFQTQEGARSHKSIVAVGRLEDQKGLIYLIKACHILHSRGIEYECTIIGEGPEKEMYQNLIAELKIPNISLPGCLPNEAIKGYLDRATIFVLPCDIAPDGRRDILANALKEAMAMQVPVMTSKMCGIEELVDDGVNGFLVPPQCPEALADAIEKNLDCPDISRKMGEEGRKKVEKDFNVKLEVKKLEKIFQKALNHSRTQQSA